MMNGKAWLEQQERQLPGFLRQAYEREGGKLGYTEAADEDVAAALSSVAAIYGVKDLTANVVQKARLALGMRRCKSERKAKAAPLAVEHLPAALPAPPAPEQPALPGVELEGRGVWALYREMRELKAAIMALTKALSRERAA